MGSTATDQGRWSARSAKWIAIVALAASARADVVVLKDGRRVEGTVVSEVLLKVLAHNVSRLIAAKRLSRVYCAVTAEGLLLPVGYVFPATL